MPVRNKLKSPSVAPDWLASASETTTTLFNAAHSEYLKIKGLISNPIRPSLRDQKINLSAIARAAGRDKSLLSSRRQPDLVAWINDRNIELKALLEKTSKPKGKKVSPNQLRTENAELRAANAQALTLGLRTFVQEVLDSDLLHDRDKLAADNIRLRSEVQKLRETIDNLQILCRTQSKEIGRLSRNKLKTPLELVPSTPQE